MYYNNSKWSETFTYIVYILNREHPLVSLAIISDSHSHIFILQEHMNFSINYTKPPDNAFGGLNQNGTWKGIIRHLQDRTTDIG